VCSFAVATVALDKLPPVHHEQVEINVFRTLLLVSMGMWRTQTSTVSHSGQRPRRQAKHPDLPSFAPSAADEYPPLHRPSLFGARLSATPWQRADPKSQRFIISQNRFRFFYLFAQDFPTQQPGSFRPLGISAAQQSQSHQTISRHGIARKEGEDRGPQPTSLP
jgi:hypothetical protein